MDLNRNQFFFLGVLVLLIGLQVRMVSSYILTNEASAFLARKSGGQAPTQTAFFASSSTNSGAPAVSRKVLEPPEWLGWCLISVGAVFVLHSLAMPRPGG